MKVFEFEQKMKAENGNVNLIYINNSVYITTLKGREEINEVKKDERVTYTSVEELKNNSEQFKKHVSYPTFKVEVTGTDAAKWKVEKL